MIYKTLLAFFLGTILSYGLPRLKPLSQMAHEKCLNLSPQNKFKKFYQAIVCGKKTAKSKESTSLKNIGLVHILVVSGAHIIYFQQTLKVLSRGHLPISILNIISFMFVLMTKIQMPALRAWCYLFISEINSSKKLNISRPELILISSIFCLTVDQEEYISFSLPLSWLASLGIYAGQTNFSRSLYCYLFLQPILLQMSPLSPLTVITNAYLAPILGQLLFPFCFISFFIPQISFITDLLWQTLFFIAQNIESAFYVKLLNPVELTAISLWLFALTINLILIWKQRRDHFYY